MMTMMVSNEAEAHAQYARAWRTHGYAKISLFYDKLTISALHDKLTISSMYDKVVAVFITDTHAMDYPIFFADQLKQHFPSLRKSRGLKQADLARQLGVVQSRIAALEKKPSTMTVDTFFRLLKALDVQLVLRDEHIEPGNTASVASHPISKRVALKSDKSEGEW